MVYNKNSKVLQPVWVIRRTSMPDKFMHNGHLFLALTCNPHTHTHTHTHKKGNSFIYNIYKNRCTVTSFRLIVTVFLLVLS